MSTLRLGQSLHYSWLCDLRWGRFVHPSSGSCLHIWALGLSDGVGLEALFLALRLDAMFFARHLDARFTALHLDARPFALPSDALFVAPHLDAIRFVLYPDALFLAFILMRSPLHSALMHCSCTSSGCDILTYLSKHFI